MTKDDQINTLVQCVVETNRVLAKLVTDLAEQNGRFADRVLTPPEDQTYRVVAQARGSGMVQNWEPPMTADTGEEYQDAEEYDMSMPPPPSFADPGVDSGNGGPGAGAG